MTLLWFQKGSNSTQLTGCYKWTGIQYNVYHFQPSIQLTGSPFELTMSLLWKKIGLSLSSCLLITGGWVRNPTFLRLDNHQAFISSPPSQAPSQLLTDQKSCPSSWIGLLALLFYRFISHFYYSIKLVSMNRVGCRNYRWARCRRGWEAAEE